MRKYWVTLCCATLFGTAVASAVEPKCECPSASAKNEVGVPLLSRVPYLSRLFKVVGAPDAEAGNEQAFERIGIDFDVECPETAGQPLHLQCFELLLNPAVFGGECQKTCSPCAGCPGAACQATVCQAGVCQAAACQAVCKAAACESCAKKCPACAECCCTEKGCGKSCAAVSECSDKCTCAGKTAVVHVHQKKACCCGETCSCGATCGCGASCGCGKTDVAMWHHIVELASGKAAAEAALAAKEESFEMLDSLAELAVENGKLTAQVEAQERQHEMFSELIELAKENATLKAKVELAAAQNELLKQAFGVAVENERLKVRIAQLEGQSGSGGAAQTAAKPTGQEPAR